MQVLAYLRNTWRKKDKSRAAIPVHRIGAQEDGEWDFGAHQTPDSTTHTSSPPNSASPVPGTQYAPRSSSLTPPRVLTPSRNSFLRDEQPHHPLTESSMRGPPSPQLPLSVDRQASPRPVTTAVDHENGRQPKPTPGVARSESKLPSNPSPGLPDEGIVLVAAAAIARESRSVASNGDKLFERRRRAHSIAAARMIDPTKRPMLRHAASDYASAIQSFPSPPPLPSPSVSDPTHGHSEAGPSSGRLSLRHTMMRAKRSMPQLHNVWENFLEEASEEDLSSSAVESNRRFSNGSRRTLVRKGSDLSIPPGREAWRPEVAHPPLPRHLPTPSTSSNLTITTISSSNISPSLTSLEMRNLMSAPPQQLNFSSSTIHSPSLTDLRRQSRMQGRVRTSHQTRSSSSSLTGSTSSLAYSMDFNSVSSMTTVYDGDESDVRKAETSLLDVRPDHLHLLDANPPTDLLSSSQHRNNSSPASFRSSSTHTLYSTAPHTPLHTPVATPSHATPNLLYTPPLSRSPSRSPIPSRSKVAGRPKPSLINKSSFQNSLPDSRWRGTPSITPENLIHDPCGSPYTPASSISNTFPNSSRHIPRSSDSSDACSTEDDVLSDLDYYTQQWKSPTPMHSASPSPRRRPIPLVPARSKSASNIRLVAKAEFDRERLREQMEFSGDHAGSAAGSYAGERVPPHVNELHLYMGPHPPSAAANSGLASSKNGHLGHRRMRSEGGSMDSSSSHSTSSHSNAHSHASSPPPSPSPSSSTSSPLRRAATLKNYHPSSPTRTDGQKQQAGSDITSIASHSRSHQNSPLPAVRPLEYKNAKAVGSGAGRRPPPTRPIPEPPGAGMDVVQWGYAL